MEIQEIKTKLTLSEVIKHYGLKADKHNRICCPFHDDKTPSLQLYYKTQTAFCFSTNCTTHGKAIDVIDFILYYEKCTKHQAIKKAEQMIGGVTIPATIPERNKRLPATGFLERMFTYFKNAVHNSPPAKEYLQKRCLDFLLRSVSSLALWTSQARCGNATNFHVCLFSVIRFSFARVGVPGSRAVVGCFHQQPKHGKAA